MPAGFRKVKITENTTTADKPGYDAIALYDDVNKRLIIVNKGADSESPAEIAMARAGGLAQVKEAQDFLDDTLNELADKKRVPKHIIFTGHSLGGVLSVAQAVR